jgi:hypothetical protein
MMEFLMGKSCGKELWERVVISGRYERRGAEAETSRLINVTMDKPLS